MQNWAMEQCFKQRVTLYCPLVEDLWFKEKLMNDEETMSYNHAWGGTIPFPKKKWKVWYDKWLINHENERYYRYVKENNVFIGEIAYHHIILELHSLLPVYTITSMLLFHILFHDSQHK